MKFLKTFETAPRYMLALVVMAVVLFLFAAVPVMAQVSGPCVDCHTMHNSQSVGVGLATEMAKEFNAAGSLIADTTPNDRLLKRDGCIGCHRGDYNDASFDMMDKFPKVWDADLPSTGPNLGCSAGGNFRWVSTLDGGADAKGHNVVGISAPDADMAVLNIPPGWNGSDFTGTQGTARGPFTASDQLTCSGTFGCHGDPSIPGDFPSLSGAHHGVQGPGGFTNGYSNDTTPVKSLSNSYRFLYGIKGVEDADWEYTVSSGDHNQYHGINRATSEAVDNTTISHLCCECHGDFHAAQQTVLDINDDPVAQGFVSPWNRHPTDFDMNNTATGSEYKKYNEKVTTGTYSTLAPVGRDMSSAAYSAARADLLVNTDVLTSGNAIVTCISCHRAHGSEFDDLLRWDYNTRAGDGSFTTGTQAASGDGLPISGCFVCHTTKDDKI